MIGMNLMGFSAPVADYIDIIALKSVKIARDETNGT